MPGIWHWDRPSFGSGNFNSTGIGPYLPVLTQTMLIPFKGVIVYDGLMTSYNISFGPGIRRNLNEDFKEAKTQHVAVHSERQTISRI